MTIGRPLLSVAAGAAPSEDFKSDVPKRLWRPIADKKELVSGKRGSQ